MTTRHKTTGAAFLAFILTACATDPSSQQPPAWTVESDGFVSTECVTASSSLAIDRKEALSKAQVTLAQQLEAKIKNMDKIQMEKNGDQVADRFSSRSHVVVDNTVRGARIQRQEYVNFRGREQFCLQIAVTPNDRPPLFDAVLQAADVRLSDQNKETLNAVYAEEKPSAAPTNKSEGRVALIIGNKDYTRSALTNSLNDARAVRDKLTRLGFDGVYLENGSLQDMENAVAEFKRKLAGQKAGVFYYSGHGIQYEGENYLLPVDNRNIDAGTLKYKALNIGQVLDSMQEAGPPVNIVILDACRDNPFSGTRGGSRGLANLSGPAGSIIAFSTAPGQTADDGNGRNGTYTKHLLAHLDEAGITVEQMFKKVRQGVEQETHQKQIPWENSSLSGDFCFNGCTAP